MVKHPGEYTWSSYLHNAGLAAEATVKPHRLYRALGLTEEARSKAYQALVKAPMDAAMLKTIRESTKKGWAMGGGRFKTRIETLTDRRVAPLPKGRPKRQPPE